MTELNYLAESDATLNASGSLCPATKAADMIGDRWTLLLLRELLLGTSRYNAFQRALPRISPTVLSKRLKQMESDGLLIKKEVAGEKATEYRLTRCGRELAPVIDYMARWGLRWARRRIDEEDLDAGGLMWDFHRTLRTGELPDGETTFCITMPELDSSNRWWLVARDGVVDLCTDDPGKEVDLYVTGSLGTLAEVWMGDRELNAALRDEQLKLMGASYLMKTAAQWFPTSRYADVRPERYLSGNDASASTRE